MRIYDIALQVGLVILAIGVIHRVDAWLLRYVGKRGSQPQRRPARLCRAQGACWSGIFSLRIFAVLRALVVDVLFQARILRDAKDPLVWPMHLLVFFGFMLLLLFHALGNIFATLIYPRLRRHTLNPFMFLRDLFGLIMLVGSRAGRRSAASSGRSGPYHDAGRARPRVWSRDRPSRVSCWTGVKITSYDEFTRMVRTTGPTCRCRRSRRCAPIWVEDYGTGGAGAASRSRAARSWPWGREVHEAAVRVCHRRPRRPSSPTRSRGLIAPVAASLDRGRRSSRSSGTSTSCPAASGSCYLAFGKMFHIISTPVSIFVAEIGAVSSRSLRWSPPPGDRARRLQPRRRLPRELPGSATAARADRRRPGLTSPWSAYLGQKSARRPGQSRRLRLVTRPAQSEASDTMLGRSRQDRSGPGRLGAHGLRRLLQLLRHPGAPGRRRSWWRSKAIPGPPTPRATSAPRASCGPWTSTTRPGSRGRSSAPTRRRASASIPAGRRSPGTRRWTSSSGS